MDNSQQQHLEELKQTHERRLNILEKQAATFGLATPPHITIEIETIRRQISIIDSKLLSYAVSQLVDIKPQKINILFLSSAPSDTTRLRFSQELREIKEKLRLSTLRDEFEIESRESIRTSDVSQALLDFNPHIVHFSGHGTNTGMLCFENAQSRIHPVEPQALADLFEQFAHVVNCVVLNACYSEIQANAISQHIRYVIGMRKEIEDEVAIAFSIGFYQALGAGRTIEEAYKLGRVQVRLQGVTDSLIPLVIQHK